MFVYEGHRVKVKVTGAKKVENPRFRIGTDFASIKHTSQEVACRVGFSETADRTVRPPSVT